MDSTTNLLSKLFNDPQTGFVGAEECKTIKPKIVINK